VPGDVNVTEMVQTDWPQGGGARVACGAEVVGLGPGVMAIL